MSLITYRQDGKDYKTSASFYRGESVNFFPKDGSLATPSAIEEYFVKGWVPAAGFVAKDTPVVAFGSCFAANISKYLHARDYNVLTKKDERSYVTTMGDGIVHTFAIRQQFEWAWLNKTPSVELWHGYKAEEFGYDEEARQATRDLFNAAEVFVITLGLSEIWYDEPTGEVFWRAVPAHKIDPSRHKFRVSTQAENKANLHEIRRLIRAHRPDAKILFSLSPIPLTATFRPVSCMTANSVSKAVLRSALDEFIREAQDENLFYFPSYEVVMHGFNNQWLADRKHVYTHVLDFNMKIFEYFFCAPGIDRQELEDSFRKAQAIDARIGREGRQVAETASPKLAPQTPDEKRAARRQSRIQERVAQRKAARVQERMTQSG